MSNLNCLKETKPATLLQRSEEYQVVDLLVDNGHHKWVTMQAPLKFADDRSDVRWSQWVESLRKAAECNFGIMKGRLIHSVFFSQVWNSVVQKSLIGFGWNVVHCTKWSWQMAKRRKGRCYVGKGDGRVWNGGCWITSVRTRCHRCAIDVELGGKIVIPNPGISCVSNTSDGCGSLCSLNPE